MSAPHATSRTAQAPATELTYVPNSVDVGAPRHEHPGQLHVRMVARFVQGGRAVPTLRSVQAANTQVSTTHTTTQPRSYDTQHAPTSMSQPMSRSRRAAGTDPAITAARRGVYPAWAVSSRSMYAIETDGATRGT